MDTTTQPVSSTTLSVKEALGLLDQVTKSHVYHCFIPSVQDEISFVEVTTGQQKELLKTVVDSPFYKSKFITTIYEILQQNSRIAQSNFSFENLNIIDKQVMLLKMRLECFDKNFEVVSSESGVKPKQFNLSDIYEQAKSVKSVNPSTVKGGQVTLHVAVPSIETEYKLEKELHENIDVMAVNDAVALRTVLGDLFVSEISKYVTSIEINNNTIDLRPLNFRARIELLEKLPNTTIKGVITYIDKVKSVIDSITTVELPVKGTKKTVKETFPIDGTFFVTT